MSNPVYIVSAGHSGELSQKIAVKQSMDDALDLIAKLEAFDKAEGFFQDHYYEVAVRTARR